MDTNKEKLLKAVSFQNQNNTQEAERLLREILETEPNNVFAIYSLVLILIQRSDFVEALAHAKQGVEIAPMFAPIQLAYATVLQHCGRIDEALIFYDKAIQLDPDYKEALLNSGVLLRQIHQHHEAVKRFNQVLAIDPDNLSALSNCAILLTEFRRSEEAIRLFERLLSLKPDFPYALGNLLYEKLHICDWTNYDSIRQRIINGIENGIPTCGALALMSISDSAHQHYQAAKLFAQKSFSDKEKQLSKGNNYNHDKIRIAYISPDLREHPVGHLMAGIFEHHDKSKFETIAISLGIDDHSRLRSRMLKAFDHFIDCRAMNAEKIAEVIREMEIDIAVDLGGYTSDTRSDVFTYRPAPAHVNFLGYPGSMAMTHMDYIIADRHVIPESDQEFYSERVIYLPECYLPTDSSLKISDQTPSRKACGLPENGFVFCSFSHDYKISPAIFDIWMKLLKQIPDSVIWLMSRNELSQRHLKAEAELRGVDPNRLIFAERTPLVEDHLARYRNADLFLDTHPYNAHTTAADALMTGLPIITCMGNSFPSRVAGSFLHALGVPELIAYSHEAYESLALQLANEPILLNQIREKISRNKVSVTIFNSEKFCRSLEDVYTKIYLDTKSTKPEASDYYSNKSLEAVYHDLKKSKYDTDDIKTALALLNQNNLPQSELYARACLASDNTNPIALRLIEELRLKYGMHRGFELSEKRWQDSNETRYLLIKAWGYGFWSEIHHLASQLLIAELTGRKPIVLWGENCIFRNKKDRNAFLNYFNPISDIDLDSISYDSSIFPSKWNWNNLYLEDINKWSGEGSRLAAQLIFARQEKLVVSDFYSTIDSILPWISPSSVYFGMSDDAIYAEIFQRYINSKPEILEKAQTFYGRYMNERPWVAVHIRGSDKINESPQLAKTNSEYFGFIDRIIEINPEIGIFLLTDTSQILEEFKSRYSDRLLFTDASRSTDQTGVHLSGHDGIAIGEEVLIDAILATQCQYFIGNQESNVSMGIASLRSWPKGFIFLLGEKNIRRANLFLHNTETNQNKDEQPREVLIEKYLKIYLPPDHNLDQIKRTWRRYDKPIAEISTAISKLLNRRLVVIDIGANIGDTAALICQEHNAWVLAVEGNPKFIPFLRRNASLIGPNVIIEESFIGEPGSNVLIKPSTHAGTAAVASAFTESEISFTTKSIENVISRNNSFQNPDFIKIDTDGWDFAIIDSMRNWLIQNKPVLFFEFDPSFSNDGASQALRAIETLLQADYDTFVVFDNYGNPICEIESNQVTRFNEFCNWLFCHRNFGMTICYLDVLAIPKNKNSWLREIRKQHRISSDDELSSNQIVGNNINILDIDSVLVIKPDALGDFILASPFFRELRNALPNAEITVATQPHVLSLAKNCPYIDHIHALNHSSTDLDSVLQEAQKLRHLSKKPFDLAILLRWDIDWYGASILIGASLATWKLGYSENCSPRKKQINAGYDENFFTHTISDNNIDHEVVKNLRILKFIGIDIKSDAIECWWSKEDRSFVDNFFISQNISKPFIALGIGSSQAYKKLTTGQWIKIIHLIQQKTSSSFIIFGNDDDYDVADQLNQHTNAISTTGLFSPSQTCYALTKSLLVITLDSFVKHAGAAAGKPIIEISPLAKTGNMDSEFGDKRFVAFGAPYKTVRPNSPTLPCTEDGCYASAPHCILTVDLTEIADAYDDLLRDRAESVTKTNSLKNEQ